MHVRSLAWEDPLEEGMVQLTPVFMPGESHEQRSLAGYGTQGRKESDTTEVTQDAHTDCSMPGFPVLYYLPEFAQIHVH